MRTAPRRRSTYLRVPELGDASRRCRSTGVRVASVTRTMIEPTCRRSPSKRWSPRHVRVARSRRSRGSASIRRTASPTARCSVPVTCQTRFVPVARVDRERAVARPSIAVLAAERDGQAVRAGRRALSSAARIAEQADAAGCTRTVDRGRSLPVAESTPAPPPPPPPTGRTATARLTGYSSTSSPSQPRTAAARAASVMCSA